MSTHTLRLPPLTHGLKLWPTLATNDWIDGPRPPERSLIRAPGGNPIEILLLGGGPATGYGVSTHELSLAGHLARKLAQDTGRGINMEVLVNSRVTIAGVHALAAEVDTRRFDAIVLSLGVQDAMDRVLPSYWGHEMASLVSRLRPEQNTAFPRLFLLAVSPISRVVDVTRGARRTVDDRSHQFNDQLKLLAHNSPDIHFVEFQPRARPRDGRHRDSDTYRDWACQIAPTLSSLLQQTSPIHNDLISEEHRTAALRGLSILDTPADERLDRIVSVAQRRFGATAAALSFMDADRQWFKSVAGTRLTSVPRGSTFCEWTIKQLTPFIVEDAAQEPRFSELPLVARANIRAYAGHPIVDPNGTVVGALCVIFLKPRTFNDEDLAFLRQLAALAEALLLSG